MFSLLNTWIKLILGMMLLGMMLDTSPKFCLIQPLPIFDLEVKVMGLEIFHSLDKKL